MTGSRHRWSVRALCCGAVMLLASCGLPREGNVQRVDDNAVPYQLLDSAVPSSGGTEEAGSAESKPSVFWLLKDNRLIPAATDSSCGEQPAAVVERLLEELAAGPQDDERAAGRSTAIPPESALALVAIEEGTAEVQVDPETEISADRLPAAIGQVVLTVTSARGVESVLLVSGEAVVPAPLPGGALTDAPVTAEDYADLLPGRYRNLRRAGCTEP